MKTSSTWFPLWSKWIHDRRGENRVRRYMHNPHPLMMMDLLTQEAENMDNRNHTFPNSQTWKQKRLQMKTAIHIQTGLKGLQVREFYQTQTNLLSSIRQHRFWWKTWRLTTQKLSGTACSFTKRTRSSTRERPKTKIRNPRIRCPVYWFSSWKKRFTKTQIIQLKLI